MIVTVVVIIMMMMRVVVVVMMMKIITTTALMLMVRGVAEGEGSTRNEATLASRIQGTSKWAENEYFE
jgi:hypothetical protein